MQNIDYQFMIYQYPVLRQFIIQCQREQAGDKLLDFLFSLETEDQHNHRGH